MTPQKIINLTPHTVKVMCGAETCLEIPASGQVARCSTERGRVGSLDIGMTGTQPIPVHAVKYGQVTGLPEAQDGVLLLVSALVRQALPSRRDLVSPGELVRDSAGQPIGCSGFDINY